MVLHQITYFIVLLSIGFGKKVSRHQWQIIFAETAHKLFKNSFGYSDAVLWNSLAIELRQASTLGINLYLTASTSFDNLNIFFYML